VANLRAKLKRQYELPEDSYLIASVRNDKVIRIHSQYKSFIEIEEEEEQNEKVNND